MRRGHRSNLDVFLTTDYADDTDFSESQSVSSVKSVVNLRRFSQSL